MCLTIKFTICFGSFPLTNRTSIAAVALAGTVFVASFPTRLLAIPRMLSDGCESRSQ